LWYCDENKRDLDLDFAIDEWRYTFLIAENVERAANSFHLDWLLAIGLFHSRLESSTWLCILKNPFNPISIIWLCYSRI
jgi:hypothetical protein